MAKEQAFGFLQNDLYQMPLLILINLVPEKCIDARTQEGHFIFFG